MSSQEHLDINLSSTFVEVGVSMLNLWSKQGEIVLQKARGSFAPYRIRNRTGSPILIWSDIDGAANAADSAPIKIENEQMIDWRFDDWKTMREVSQTTTVAILLTI